MWNVCQRKRNAVYRVHIKIKKEVILQPERSWYQKSPELTVCHHVPLITDRERQATIFSLLWFGLTLGSSFLCVPITSFWDGNANLVPITPLYCFLKYKFMAKSLESWVYVKSFELGLLNSTRVPRLQGAMQIGCMHFEFWDGHAPLGGGSEVQ